MLICPIFCPASFSPLSLHLQCHSGWQIRHQELQQEMQVRSNAFWFIIPNFSLHPLLHCTKELHKLLVMTHLWFALCTFLLHMTKTSSNPKPTVNGLLKAIECVGMERTCHKQVHAFIVLNLVSFRNTGSNRIHILYELGTNKINILFELGTQTF